MLFPRTLAALSLAALATAQTTTPTPAQASAVVNDLVSYISSLVGDPAFTSNIGVLETAIPSNVLSSLATDSAYLSQLATATPSWFTALPGGVQSYYGSIATAEASIVSKDLKGPAPTHGPAAGAVMAGLGAAAGVVALAL